MKYTYATLILNETGAEINERNLTAVLEAADATDISSSRIKALVAALEDVDLDEYASDHAGDPESADDDVGAEALAETDEMDDEEVDDEEMETDDMDDDEAAAEPMESEDMPGESSGEATTQTLATRDDDAEVPDAAEEAADSGDESPDPTDDAPDGDAGAR